MTTASSSKSSRRAAVASLAGTTVEYYDFFIYGTASALIFGPQFFPNFSPAAGVLASFAVFGAGFVARPLGGVVMGHFGDKVGRKSMLILSLLMVGFGTFLIGVLPNYATIGIWAPILLVTLRLIQGFGVGGEWSGGVLMSVEHAPKGREALWGMFPQMGIPLGLTIANLAFLAVAANGAFSDWLWRVPFLFSGVLIFVGLYVRLGVTESPAFKAIGEKRRRLPLLDVVKEHPKAILIGAGLPVAPIMITYVFATFSLNYMTETLGISNFVALMAILFGTVLYALELPIMGIICDRTGKTGTVFLLGTLWFAVVAVVYFPLLNTASVPMLFVATGMLSVALAATFGPVAVLITQLFPAELRFSGSSLAYQIATLVGGAPAPFVAAAIFTATGSWVGIGVYMLVAVVTSALAGVWLLQSRRRVAKTGAEALQPNDQARVARAKSGVEQA